MEKTKKKKSWSTALSRDAWSRWWHGLAMATPHFPQLHHDKEALEYAQAQLRSQGEQLEAYLAPTKLTELDYRLAGLDSRYVLWACGVVALDMSFLYRLALVVLSVTACLWNPFIFCLHLLDICLQNAILLNVLRSVIHNGRQLLFTVGFTACVIYIYTIVAFNFFRSFYRNDDRAMCDDMLSCLVYNLNTGLRSGGGIGDELESAIGTDQELWRIIFDISFFFVVIVILLAIVQVWLWEDS